MPSWPAFAGVRRISAVPGFTSSRLPRSRRSKRSSSLSLCAGLRGCTRLSKRAAWPCTGATPRAISRPSQLPASSATSMAALSSSATTPIEVAAAAMSSISIARPPSGGISVSSRDSLSAVISSSKAPSSRLPITPSTSPSASWHWVRKAFTALWSSRAPRQPCSSRLASRVARSGGRRPGSGVKHARTWSPGWLSSRRSPASVVMCPRFCVAGDGSPAGPWPRSFRKDYRLLPPTLLVVDL
ncbi:hypothetical protein D3C86_1416730 [compost metagenome]